MSKSKNRPDIDTLLIDRARFEAWLDQLMAKASQMPEHVVERVRADYQQRLNAVVDDLRSRADDLRAEGESLDERIAALELDLSAKRDARAEDELRALVGEYDEDAWRTKAAEHDHGIQKLDADRGARQAEVVRVRELLGEATRPSRAMRVIAEADIPDEPTPVEPMPEMVELPPEPVQAALELPFVEPEFTPLDEAVAVADLPLIPTEPEEPQAPEPRLSQIPTTRRPSPFDEIGFLRTVVGRATPFSGVDSSSGPAAAPAPAPELPPEAPAMAAPVAPPEPPAPVRRSSFSDFEAPPIPDAAVAAPVRASAASMPAFGDALPETGNGNDSDAAKAAAEAARSLKCQECGWMNFPTEWYCEKCGGELAAF